jgi:hypothetical protein
MGLTFLLIHIMFLDYQPLIFSCCFSQFSLWLSMLLALGAILGH